MNFVVAMLQIRKMYINNETIFKIVFPLVSTYNLKDKFFTTLGIKSPIIVISLTFLRSLNRD